jgi:tripartite-type tricarboxylate transporter receptor subunit TctC
MKASKASFAVRSLAGLAGLVLSAGLAFAQSDYPNRPITVIVPFAAGGPTDTITRIVGEYMQRELGKAVLIENVVGAGGTTATGRAARATPDGYTIMTGHMGTHAAAVGLYPKLSYDPRKDFEPIALLAGTPILILAKKDFPAKDLKEFVTYVKANAGKLNEAHAGVGSVSFTTCAFLNHLLDVKPTRVPFTGTGPSMNALVAGQVDYMCDQIVNAVPQVQAGTIKAYAVATAERNPALPNLPTTKEGGLPDYMVSAWNAMFAPKGTPKEIVDKLNAVIVKALDDETVRKRLLELGSDIPDREGRSEKALADLVSKEVDRWTPLMQEALKAAGK